MNDGKGLLPPIKPATFYPTSPEKSKTRRQFDQVSEILSKTKNDLEAADLWKKLQELKEGQS